MSAPAWPQEFREAWQKGYDAAMAEQEAERADVFLADTPIFSFRATCKFCGKPFGPRNASTGREGGCLDCHYARYGGRYPKLKKG